jgi:hypothetical protein
VTQELAGGVAVRLAALCLDDQGRLRDFLLWDAATRGALLVDLALAGRMTQTDESVTVDATPTGFEPADRLLAAMALEPERSLDWWIDHGGVEMADVAAANVASGRWTQERRLLQDRYVDRAPEITAEDLARNPDRPRAEWTPEQAALTALTQAAGSPGIRPAPPSYELVALTGPVEWMCRAVVDHLGVAHSRNKWVAMTADGGGVYYA